MTKNWLSASFVALWLADIVLTLMFVAHYGASMEANPLMRYAIEHGGTAGFITAKTAVLLPLIPLHKHIPAWVYGGLVIIMLPVIYMNVHVVFWPV